MPNFFSRAKNFFGSGDVADDASTPFSLIAAATTNATLVKDSPGVLVSLHVINLNAAVRYLKFYDTKVKPTAGSGTPVRRYAIPASATGAGFALPFPVPARFQVGIAYTITSGVADNDTGVLSANDVVLTGEFI